MEQGLRKFFLFYEKGHTMCIQRLANIFLGSGKNFFMAQEHAER